MIEDAEKSELLKLIRHGFADRPCPEHIVLTGHPATEEYTDAMVFAGKTWDQLTGEFLERYSSAIYGFSPDAFCYFLPGFYSIGIAENNPWLLINHSLLATLDRSNTPASWDQFFSDRWPKLNAAELDVTQRWLLWLSDFKDISISDAALSRAFDTVELLKNMQSSIPLALHSHRPRKT